MAKSKAAKEQTARQASKKHMKRFQDWEAVKPDDYYVRCASSFLHHPAFLALSPAARMTLIFMREKTAGNREFHFPLSSYAAFISRDGFQRAIKQLVALGFVEITGKNKNLRKCNDYRFSSAWTRWTPR